MGDEAGQIGAQIACKFWEYLLIKDIQPALYLPANMLSKLQIYYTLKSSE